MNQKIKTFWINLENKNILDKLENKNILEKERGNQEAIINELNGREEILRNQNEILIANCNKYQEQISSLEAFINEYETKLGECFKELSELKAKIAAKNTEITRLNSQI